MALVAVSYEGVERRGEQHAAIAQLGERTTEDRKVPGSIPGCGTSFSLFTFLHCSMHWEVFIQIPCN